MDFVFGSPPYENARAYNGAPMLQGEEWVDWMFRVVVASVRVSRGPVAFVVDGSMKNGVYSMTPQKLMADLHRAGIKLQRPPIYKRFGIPGKNPFFRNCYENIVFAFGGKFWADSTAMGHAPVCKPGGATSHRTKAGTRANRERRAYSQPKRTVATNIIDCGAVGGGNIGDRTSHESQAPFPEYLAEYMIRTFCPPHTCFKCGVAIEQVYDQTILQTVWRAVRGLCLPKESGQILFDDVQATGHPQAKGGLSGVPQADSVREGESRQPVLRPEVFEQKHGKGEGQKEGLGRNKKGIHTASSGGPSVRGERVRSGASPCHGEGDRPLSSARRGGSSQERKKERQPAGKSGTFDGIRPQPDAEESEVSDVRSVPSPCECCGTDLSRASNRSTGIILDPFVGSGTTCKVALVHRRRTIGFDLDPKQITLSDRRCAVFVPTGDG